MMTLTWARGLTTGAMLGLVAGCHGGGYSGKAADWAQDACKTFPKEAASKASGVAVGKTETPGQTGSDAVLVSTCTYSTADGRIDFGVLPRQGRSDGDPQLANLEPHPEIPGPSEGIAMPAVWSTRCTRCPTCPRPGA